MCIVAIALELGSDTVSLIMDGSQLEVIHNGNQRPVQNGFDIGNSYRCDRPNNIEYIFTGPNSFNLHITQLDVYMNIYLTTTKCDGTTGVCGTCTSGSGCSNDEHVCLMQQNGIVSALTQNAVGQEEINDYFKNFALSDADSLLSGKISSKKAGYAMYVNGRDFFVESAPFTVNCLNTEDGYLTIEITMKVLDANGVLFAFASEDTFAVILNDGTVGFQLGNDVKMTPFQISTNEWIVFSMIYKVDDGTAILHHIDGNGVHKYLEVEVFENVFPIGGAMSIGRWKVSVSLVTNAPITYFEGYIDRFVIWKKRFGIGDEQRHAPYYLLSTEPYLGLLYNFDEGFSSRVYDKVNNVALSVPMKGWYVSEADITEGAVTSDTPPESLFSTDDIRETAEETCTRLLDTGALGSTCDVEAYQTTKDYFYLVCLNTIGESGKQSSAMDSVIAMSQQCEDRSGADPADAELCNEFPLRHTTNLYGPDCSQACYYGYYEERTQTCTCDEGYWGAECEKTCLLDAYGNICSNHGECNLNTGDCICLPAWDGNDICGSCADGYDGPDCSIFEMPAPADPTKTYCEIGYSKLETFNQMQTDLTIGGALTILSVGFLNVVVSKLKYI